MTLRVFAAATLLLLGACTPSPDASPPSATSPAASPSAGASSASPGPARTTGAPPAPAPPDGGCYRLTFAQLRPASNDSEPVSCRDPHTAQTIHVGELDAVEPDAVSTQVSTTCPRKLAAYLGGDRSTRALSRFKVVWFTPTPEQLDRGATWFRCDAIAFAGHEELAPLPAPRRLAGLLDNDRALERYGLCGTAAPGARHFARVICSRRHSWQAIATIRIDGGARYPGVRKVRVAGDQSCKDTVRRVSDSTLRFRYGWEWPTKDQWERGQHYGFCWAPDS
ncbi:MAG TPA: septum formation family protein [Nocardioidaceae bacterium]|nr:septum formation family protein [Nocardioidaceae bacterium]